MDTQISESNNEAPNGSETQTHVSEEQGKDSEAERNGSEGNGNVSEQLRKTSERTQEHTLTIHEVAKDLEERGLYLTERTVLNWCHPNKKGIVRLNCYYEPREERYFITPTSVEAAFEEELKKRRLHSDSTGNTFGKIGNVSEPQPNASEEQTKDSEAERNGSEGNGNVSEVYKPVEDIKSTEEHDRRIKELEQEVMDLRITNKGKDYFIEQLKHDRKRLFRNGCNLSGSSQQALRRLGCLRRSCCNSKPHEAGSLIPKRGV